MPPAADEATHPLGGRTTQHDNHTTTIDALLETKRKFYVGSTRLYSLHQQLRVLSTTLRLPNSTQRADPPADQALLLIPV